MWRIETFFNWSCDKDCWNLPEYHSELSEFAKDEVALWIHQFSLHLILSRWPESLRNPCLEVPALSSCRKHGPGLFSTSLTSLFPVSYPWWLDRKSKTRVCISDFRQWYSFHLICFILIRQGLRTLELCVDNLQPDFLYDHIQPVRADLMQVSLLKIIAPLFAIKQLTSAIVFIFNDSVVFYQIFINTCKEKQFMVSTYDCSTIDCPSWWWPLCILQLNSQALWRTLRNTVETIAHVAFRVLGKFGGASRRNLKEPQKVNFQIKYFNYSSYGLLFSCQLPPPS